MCRRKLAGNILRRDVLRPSLQHQITTPTFERATMSEKTHFAPKPLKLTYELQDDIDADGNGYAWAIRVMKTDGSYAQNPGYATSEGYAQLFSAAPDLLKSLGFALEFLLANDDGGIGVDSRIVSARAAIAKATTQRGSNDDPPMSSV